MSLQFSNTTTNSGIIQNIEKECGFDYGEISGNTELMQEFTNSINTAHDDLLDIGFKNSGTWQLDDSNHTDYPFIHTSLVSGQRDYTFLNDENGNLILDIERVMVADSTGTYREIHPVDIQTKNSNQSDTSSLIDGQNLTGVPTRYDKTANGILLDLIPNYDLSRGLKVFINREGSYFTTSDTVKKPGVPGLLHEWYFIKPSYVYARRNDLKSFNKLALEVQKFEQRIISTFNLRQKDVIKRLQANVENTK